MNYVLGEIEAKFAQLIWDNEPISSGELVKLAEAQLGWKKSTTYTVLKKLSDREIFQNIDSIVTSRLSQEEYLSRQSKSYVQEFFQGSLPMFLNAFARKEKLSFKEIDALQRLIDEQKER